MLRIVAVSGDLAHPRKNIADVVEASVVIALEGKRVSLELIGRHVSSILDRFGVFPPELEISTPGPIDRLDVYRRVQRADVLVMPSLYEEWGYVAVEALLLGTPVLAYPVYPFGSMLDSDLGIIAGGNKLQDLVAALHRIDTAENRASGEREALAARANERFGAATIGKTLSEIWARSPIAAKS